MGEKGFVVGNGFHGFSSIQDCFYGVRLGLVIYIFPVCIFSMPRS